MTTTTVLWILLVTLVGAAIYCLSLSLENHKLRRQIADNSGEMFDEGKKLMKQIDDLTTANTKLELLNAQYVAEVILQGRTIEGLEERLAKFDRTRGEDGKFVKSDGTYTPYDTEEPEASDVQPEDAEDEYIPSGMRDLDTDMML